MSKYRWGLLAAGVVSGGFFLSSLAFPQDSVHALKEAVRSDFQVRKGITLADVGFVQKNEHELYGFAAFKIGLREIVKACVARREHGDASYVWTCD
jgi:hypothetical protein